MKQLPIIFLLLPLCLKPDLQAQEIPLSSGFETGRIMDTVLCTHSPGQSYALFLPEEYTPQRSWPILYIYDPAARASLALRRFQAGAEQLNWILACSNNSRNGPWEDILAAADAVLLDTQEKLSVDLEQIYTAGFSGGSRAAMGIAVITGRVSGVIGCGAVFSSVEAYRPGPETAKFLYVGMVGLKDMNYLEHLNARAQLEGLGIENHLILFDAGHEWPPSDRIARGMQWLALKRQAREKAVDSTLLEHYRQAVEEDATGFFEDGYPVAAVSLLESLKSDFGDLLETKPIDTRIRQITGEKPYQQQLKAIRKINDKESALQQKYISAFVELYWTINGSALSTSQEEWWEVQINHLKRQTKDKDKLNSNSAYRLLNLISARSAESCFEFLSRNNYPLALALNELWLKVSPEDVYANWHMAKIHALMSNKNQALNYLEKAVAYGMQYVKSLRAPEFELLEGEERYEELIRLVERRED